MYLSDLRSVEVSWNLLSRSLYDSDSSPGVFRVHARSKLSNLSTQLLDPFLYTMEPYSEAGII